VQLPCPGIKFFGFCELVTRGKQTYPLTINDRKQVSIDDRFDGIAYHRLTDSGLQQPEEFMWGNRMLSEYRSKMRTLLAFKTDKFSEEFIFDFSNAMPDLIEVSGYKSVDVTNSVSIKTNQESIYKEEFGGGDYEKHIIKWNIYAIEYEVQFVKC
jgi:hypothetical protein